MKSLNDQINESLQSINESRFEIDECRAKGNMKYGFMYYDDYRGIVEVIQFNKLSEYCDSLGFEIEDMMDLEGLEVGDSVYDGDASIYTRIW